MKTKNYKYVHIINGALGHYYPGEQICYAVRTRPVPLVESLAQIKKEQRASRAWRAGKKFNNVSIYDWRKIAV